MTIVLNHTIVPVRDKVDAAQFFASIIGLPFDAGSGHFAPVRVNDTLTLLFSDDGSFGSHHYAFHVSDIGSFIVMDLNPSCEFITLNFDGWRSVNDSRAGCNA